MRRRTGLFRRMQSSRRRTAGGGRRSERYRRGYSGIKNMIPVAVFLILLALCLPVHFSQTDGKDGSGRNQGSERDDGVTLQELSEESQEKVNVLISETGEVREIPLEEYIACVVASEMPAEFETEALKAQAVAARTYAAARKAQFEEGGCAHSDEGAYVCDTTHCQVYRDETALKEIKGDQWMEESFPKILGAVGQTEGEVLYYDGKLVEQPLFFSSGGERTENSEDVFVSAIPYLRSVESGDYEEDSPYQGVETQITLQELKTKLAAEYGEAGAQTVTSENISILGRTDGGSVSQIRFGELTLTGRQTRELLGLKSADFEVDVSGDTLTFVTTGSGHGVGLSQYGADGMAEQGRDYREILSHYYSGVEIGQI